MVEPAELKARACAGVDAWSARLWEVSASIHAHPELGYSEHHAVAQLCALFKEAGLPCETGIAATPTAFRVPLPGCRPRPSVAILAEYDALPEVGHACGHNLIATAAAGAGLGLLAVAADLPGSAVVFGCPAEESAVDDAGGKVRLVRDGYFGDQDAAIMVHPGSEDLISRRGSLAACGYEFEFIGKSAHAAAMPHEGINALDGVIQTFNGINALRQHVQSDVRIHGIITYGGAAANIVPARAVCRFRVRAADRHYLAEVAEKVVQCARAGAMCSGSRLNVREVAPVYEDTLPNSVIGRAFLANLVELGRPMRTIPKRKGRGSTDFGNVSRVVPAVSASLRIADDSVAIHSKEFAVAAISDAGRRMMLDAAKAMAMTAIDLMCDADLLDAARTEFSRRAAPET
jgi:amidohydrolase